MKLLEPILLYLFLVILSLAISYRMGIEKGKTQVNCPVCYTELQKQRIILWSMCDKGAIK